MKLYFFAHFFAHLFEIGPVCPIQACTLEHNPQCGSNGVTYGNPCQLQSAQCDDEGLVLDYSGECTGETQQTNKHPCK